MRERGNSNFIIKDFHRSILSLRATGIIILKRITCVTKIKEQ